MTVTTEAIEHALARLSQTIERLRELQRERMSGRFDRDQFAQAKYEYIVAEDDCRLLFDNAEREGVPRSRRTVRR